MLFTMTKEEAEETGTASRGGGGIQEKSQVTFMKNVRHIPEKWQQLTDPVLGTWLSC